MSGISIGIFDDHPILAQGLKAMLLAHDHLSVDFIALSREALEAKLAESAPIIQFVDVVAPDVEGLELFRYLQTSYPDVAVIAYTTLNSVILVENLLGLGVKGFVNKRQPEEQVVAAIEQVCKGEIYLPTQFQHLGRSVAQAKAVIDLSVREKQILGKIIEGRLTKEIADELQISKNTVENHRAKLFRKLEVQNVAELIKKAMALGYLS